MGFLRQSLSGGRLAGNCAGTAANGGAAPDRANEADGADHFGLASI